MENEYFNELMVLADLALSSDDIPASAIIIDQNQNIIAKSYNNRMKTKTICGHAEINAINDAFQIKTTNNLKGCKIYTSLEPCDMCFGAIRQARIDEICYVIDNNKNTVTKSFALNSREVILKKAGTREQEKIYQTKLRTFFDDNLR